MGPTESRAAAEPYAQVHETHTGIVVLVDQLAYKGKKPIKTDFLDFRTPRRRAQALGRELELNRRLAPASYLGVAQLSMPWNDAAEPVLVMRRHPDSSRLATLVRDRRPVTDALLAIADVLARFHDSAARSRSVASQGKVRAVKARWQANIAELRHYPGTVVDHRRLDTVERLAVQFISGRAVLFSGRIADGRVVDGHGDLLADDIFCLPQGPEILDCLEFDDQLRYVDTIDDVAFLAMDLEFLGRKDLADFFLEHYSKLAADPAPRSLKDFYIAYRALVRAKVDCVRFTQGHRDAVEDASRHLDIALEHLRSCSVRVAMVGGGPGTGKSTLARGLADLVGASVISTDEVRKDMLASGTIGGAPGVLDAGLYSADKVAAVYDEVLRRAHLHLASGESVILDGTWRDPRRRKQVRELASRTHAFGLELRCETAAHAAARRVAARPAGHVSDATPGIARALADYGDWSQAHPIDTSRSPSESARAAADLWRRAVQA
ncbi:AAA family ATPase [Mycobacterium sp.]|uniref:bifunctional aminoglycoside phosphotransferase/ATP-binding protein n=1 Tax=Mycobacterium sp. TaxID=1785 RepID=UPI0012870BCE|nr:AAA family ATPase [Mycobacterium sp.]KAA8964661.1 MAG: AAA family ATPase [Mycobacterium sp.]